LGLFGLRLPTLYQITGVPINWQMFSSLRIWPAVGRELNRVTKNLASIQTGTNLPSQRQRIGRALPGCNPNKPFISTALALEFSTFSVSLTWSTTILVNIF
jgi:hypothetical protein